MKAAVLSLFVLAFAVGNSPAPPHDHQPYKGSKEFEKIKTLAGTWKGKMDMGQGPMDMTVIYRVVAGGSAVEERTFPDTPMEMVTMYHDKNGQVSLTHFCMLHNQPVLKFKSSDGNSITFEFDESCGIDSAKESHMGGLVLTFNRDGSITQDWTSYEKGKAMESHPIKLKRAEK